MGVASDKHMPSNFITPAVQNMTQMWFQQDSGTYYRVRATMKLLREIFGERIISKNSNSPYPARYIDLTAPECFLSGNLRQGGLKGFFHHVTSEYSAAMFN